MCLCSNILLALSAAALQGTDSVGIHKQNFRLAEHSARPTILLPVRAVPAGSAHAAALASTAASCATLGRDEPVRKRPSWRSARPRSAGGKRANSSSIMGLHMSGVALCVG